jgi:uncharacterized membrane protein YesL
LFYATNHLAHGKPADWHTFFEGFGLYFRHSWLWGLLNIVITAALVSNFVYYSLQDVAWTEAARLIILILAFLWLATQIYTFPLMIEQEQPRLRLALRNSLVLILKRPLFIIGATLLIGLIAIVTTLIIQPAWMLITASFCAYLANQATVNSIAKITAPKKSRQSKLSNGFDFK